MRKSEKGITLIALVITIIILLILATISVQSLTNTGLFKKAQEAKNAMEKAEEEQQLMLNEYEEELNKYSGTDKYVGLEADIKCATSPENCTYNGKEQKWIPTITNGNGTKLTENKDYTVEYNTTDFIDAGDIIVTVKGCGNYTGTIIKNYTIEKATLTIITESATKEYNGTVLTADGITVEGLVNGETIEVVTTGSQEPVGSSENFYKIFWTGTAKEENYNIIDALGTLTVTAATTPVVPGSESLLPE